MSASSAVSGPGWAFSLYPQAAEGGGSFRSTYQPARSYVARGQARDPARSAAQAGRRARTSLRRYCVANGLNRFGTLTYAGSGCHDPRQVRRDVAEFFRALRTDLGGRPLPYVWVPEWHKTGHGLHLHFAVARYVHKGTIRAAWGRGFIKMKLLSDVPVGASTLTEARIAAGYLAKYVSKTFADPSARVPGLHRYDVAQGFQPAKVSLLGTSPDDALRQASEVLGQRPALTWSSDEADEWTGPPAIWAQWGR